MFGFRKLFDKSSRSARMPASPRRKATPRTQLQLEHLEDRKLMAVSFHGGPVIPHVRVENLYYGADWASSANQQNMQQLDQFTKTITQSSYMSMLGEYGVGKGSFVKSNAVYPWYLEWPGSTVSEGSIQSVLQNEIQHGFLDESDGSHLYIVYLPPYVGSQFDHANNYLGHHRCFAMSYNHADGTTSNDLVYYAVIVNPVGNPQGTAINGYSTFQQQTEIMSHELAEAVTNPTEGYNPFAYWGYDWGGWYDGSGQEIGESGGVNQQVGYLDGYLVQRDYFGRGILPQWDSSNLGTGSSFPFYTGAGNDYSWRIACNEPGFGTRYGYAGFDVYFGQFYNWQIAPGDNAGWFNVY